MTSHLLLCDYPTCSHMAKWKLSARARIRRERCYCERHVNVVSGAWWRILWESARTAIGVPHAESA